MDLYEALKAGTSEEELLKAFHKDLNEASARITAEQEEKHIEERLTTNRKNLAENLITYAEALLNENLDNLDKSISVDFIVKTLKEFEKETEQIVNLSKRLNKILEKPKNENDDDSVEIKVTAHVVNDDDIITNFLRDLK